MIFSGIRFVLSSKMSLPVSSCAQQLGISLYSPQQSVGNISTVFPDQQGFAAILNRMVGLRSIPWGFICPLSSAMNPGDATYSVFIAFAIE